MKYIVDLPEEVVEKANPFEGEIGSALHDAIYLDSFLKGIKGEIRKMPNRNPSYTHTCDVVDREDVLDIIDNHIKAGE